MKKKFYIISALLSFTVMALLSSCLKDPRYTDFSKVGTLIELPLSEVNDAGTGGIMQKDSFSIATQPMDTITVAVNVASPKPLTSDLKVTLSTTDVTAMNNYNTQNDSTFVALPSADYTVVGGLTVTVPANQRLAYFKVIINAAAIGISRFGIYALPVTIENASGQPIAQPYKTLFYALKIKP